MRTHTIVISSLSSNFPEDMDVLEFTFIQKGLLVGSLQVLVEVGYFNNWLLEEVVGLFRNLLDLI